MSQVKKSVETLVQAIREELANIKASGESYALARWPEADGDAGYMLCVVGRMLQVGDYQAGFTHIDDLTSPALDEERRGYARAESGHIASSLESIAVDPELRDEVAHGIAQNFGLDFDVVWGALSDGRISVEAAFELCAGVPRGTLFVFPGSADQKTHSVRSTADISVASVVHAPNGGLTVTNRLVATAGHVLLGTLRGASLAVPVPGGYIQVPAALYEDIAPLSTPAHASRFRKP
jgi:hypothetical protein